LSARSVRFSSLAPAGPNFRQGVRANSNRRCAYRQSRRDKPGGSLVALLIAGIVAAITSSAAACGDCSWLGNGFSIAHPRAIEIAVATRDALGAGLIENTPRAAQADALIARRVAMLVRSEQDAGDCILEILLVDDDVTFHFGVRDHRVVASRGPTTAVRKLTVVTTGPTAAALAVHRLSLDDAETRGLVIVERSSNRGGRI
jgi:hypothetical protein